MGERGASHSQTAGEGRNRGPNWARLGVDVTVPHAARVYDYWLGGKDNFAPDRALSDEFEQAIPTIRVMARENRGFLRRAVRFLAGEAGIRQFLDIGPGIPTEGNTHQIAQAIAPDSRVVYVDNDPIVLAHARALLTGTGPGKLAYLDADLRRPGRILDHPDLTATLDLSQPIALMLVAVLMLISDKDDPLKIVRTLLNALPSGSYVAITHPGYDFNPTAMKAVSAAAQHAHLTVVPRLYCEIAMFFADWALIEPGLVPVSNWRPDGPPPTDPNTAYYWAGIARKP